MKFVLVKWCGNAKNAIAIWVQPRTCTRAAGCEGVGVVWPTRF